MSQHSSEVTSPSMYQTSEIDQCSYNFCSAALERQSGGLNPRLFILAQGRRRALFYPSLPPTDQNMTVSVAYYRQQATSNLPAYRGELSQLFHFPLVSLSHDQAGL